MASVSTETINGRKRYRVTFRDADGKRRFLRLPGVAKKDAAEVASKVQAIVSARITGAPLGNAVAEWLATIGDSLHAKLAAAGLVAERSDATLGDWLTGYIDGRAAKVTASTAINWRTTREKLVDALGEGRPIRTITAADALAWQEGLADGYAPATVAGMTKKAKQFFAAAVDEKIIDASPFAKLVAGSMANEDRNVYVPAADVLRLIDLAPNAEWRLLLALARFGGLRTPSEALLLQWSDIDWAAGTMRITSPKTKRYGKGYRTVPIFGELRPYLEDAFDPSETRCVPSYSGRGCNLRTSLVKLITRAKLEPWARPWHNLRASRETDLSARYPLHTVTAWLGNTPAVAAEHYLSVLPEHLASAIKAPAPARVKARKGGTGGGTAAPGMGRKAALKSVPPQRKNPGKRCVSRGLGAVSAPPVGLEPTTQRLTAACSTN